MIWDEWRFNLGFAWADSYLRWMSLILGFISLTTSIVAAVRLVQMGLPSGYIVTHYTVYLGIDQMLSLSWLAVLLGVPILIIFGTMLLGLILFRQDNIAGYALVSLDAASTIIWILQLYHLVKINT